jgi:hypothetical protein
MLYLEYKEYFKNVAIKLKDILHSDDNKRFARINIEEVFNSSMDMDFNNICMTLEAYETGVDDQLSDNLRDMKTGAFMLVKKAVIGSFDDEDQVISDTEKTAYKIIAKMKKDKSLNTAIKHLDLGSIKINKVGPLFDNCFGWRVTFSFDESMNNNVKYGPEDWNI